MTTTLNLPPMPIIWGSAINDAGNGHINLYSAEQMLDYALAAYAAGRDAGLEESVQLCELSGALYTGLDMADAIRALKSGAKGGV
jgi:hypothetical protein